MCFVSLLAMWYALQLVYVKLASNDTVCLPAHAYTCRLLMIWRGSCPFTWRQEKKLRSWPISGRVADVNRRRLSMRFWGRLPRWKQCCIFWPKIFKTICRTVWWLQRANALCGSCRCMLKLVLSHLNHLQDWVLLCHSVSFDQNLRECPLSRNCQAWIPRTCEVHITLFRRLCAFSTRVTRGCWNVTHGGVCCNHASLWRLTGCLTSPGWYLEPDGRFPADSQISGFRLTARPWQLWGHANAAMMLSFRSFPADIVGTHRPCKVNDLALMRSTAKNWWRFWLAQCAELTDIHVTWRSWVVAFLQLLAGNLQMSKWRIHDSWVSSAFYCYYFELISNFFFSMIWNRMDGISFPGPF